MSVIKGNGKPFGISARDWREIVSGHNSALQLDSQDVFNQLNATVSIEARITEIKDGYTKEKNDFPRLIVEPYDDTALDAQAEQASELNWDKDKGFPFRPKSDGGKLLVFPSPQCSGFVGRCNKKDKLDRTDSSLSHLTLLTEQFSIGDNIRIRFISDRWYFDIPFPYWIWAEVKAQDSADAGYTLNALRRDAGSLTITGDISGYDINKIGSVSAGTIVQLTLNRNRNYFYSGEEFDAELGSDGPGPYSWIERRWDTDTDDWISPVGGRSGDEAYEAHHNLSPSSNLKSGTYVRMRKVTARDADTAKYLFTMPIKMCEE
jgi:hypothetical protein